MSHSQIAVRIVSAAAVGALGIIPMAGIADADPGFTPGATDIVGVGSDTTEFALTYLADGATVNGRTIPGWNTGRTTERLVSWDATGSAKITPRTGGAEITRPNGSGAGKTQLYNPSNPDINFARSSSTANNAEISAALYQVPFAVDGMKLAVKATGSNAPASISATDMVNIYNGTYTKWNQLTGNSGGSSADIVPMIPQSGSGTRSFFVSQLKAANGGSDVTLAGSVVEVQEHDAAPIIGNANGVAPFSTGRAKTAPGIKLLGGFAAQRALYNVVRQDDLGDQWFGDIFGPDGFVCSTAARPLIEKAGFDQLAPVSAGGVCGEATQQATTNFTTNNRMVNPSTKTVVTTRVSGRSVFLTATVTAPDRSKPEGTVRFFEGTTALGRAVPLSGGVALKALPNVTPNRHVYSAVYSSPDTRVWPGSRSAAATAIVKASSTITATVPAKVKHKARPKARINVTVPGRTATGSVKVLSGTKTLTQGVLASGKATLTLPRLKRGKVTLVFQYLGDALTLPASTSTVVTVKK